jgi:type I restriction enzyme S subunit
LKAIPSIPWLSEPIESVVADRTGGQTKILRSDYEKTGAFPVIDQGKEFSNGFTNDESKLYRGKLPLVLFGDHTRGIKFVDQPFALGADGVKALEPKSILAAKFLYYFLLKSPIEARGYSRHFKYLKEKSIPLPPLPEQDRIVEILDQADALRQQRRQADALSQRILPALFHEMFGGSGFSEATLESVSDGKDGVKCGPFGTQLSKSEFRESGVPLWGIKHVNRGFSNPTDEFISEEKAVELSSYLLVAGDIVMTRKGTIGNAHIYPASFPHGMMHSDLLRIRANHSKMTSEFLYAQLVFSESVKTQISSGSTGAIMPGINVGKLKQIQLTVPPLDQQRIFSERMKVIADYTPRQSTSSATLETLFQTLLHRAFDGSLTAKWREGHTKEVLQEMERNANKLA